MSKEALYRKYRPTVWGEVVGQDHIVSVIAQSIKHGTVAHSYLLHGSRGTGKTTVARIIAKELETAPEDIYEIDAASNRGIDDIRALRDGVSTLPFRSRYKVYIIDEVHMLTKEAWNALLKTLEEPPAHVIFILATTELEKVPETIISRCQVFTFKKPNVHLLAELVMSVGKQEGFSIDAAGAELIALVGDGSFRDAHGILQKVIASSSGKKISREDVELVTGAPKGELVNAALSGIGTRDAAAALAAIAAAARDNVDMELFLKLILEKARLALLLRYGGDQDTLLAHVSDDERSFITELSGASSKHLNSKSLIALIEAGERMKYASVKALPLEIAVMNLVEDDK